MVIVTLCPSEFENKFSGKCFELNFKFPAITSTLTQGEKILVLFIIYLFYFGGWRSKVRSAATLRNRFLSHDAPIHEKMHDGI